LDCRRDGRGRARNRKGHPAFVWLAVRPSDRWTATIGPKLGFGQGEPPPPLGLGRGYVRLHGEWQLRLEMMGSSLAVLVHANVRGINGMASDKGGGAGRTVKETTGLPKSAAVTCSLGHFLQFPSSTCVCLWDCWRLRVGYRPQQRV